MVKALHATRYKRLCSLLRARRREAQLTQDEVAGRLGKPQSFVSKYEKGERRVDLVEFLDIADAIGFKPAEFLRALRR